MQVDYQSNEIHIGTDEWVTIILPDREITVKGDGEIYTDSGKVFHSDSY